MPQSNHQHANRSNDGVRRVSIVVRTLGRRRKLLSKALASIAAQTHAEMEAIVVEDGGAAAADIVADADRARPGTFRHIPIAQSGRCAAGNVGLDGATGAFLGFLDEDDELYPDHAARLVAALDASPTHRCAYARAHREDCDGLENDAPQRVRIIDDETFIPFNRTLLWLRNRLPIQAALFRRGLYEDHGGFDPALELLEDWDLWIRYSALEDFLPVDAVTSLYRAPARLADVKEREAAHLSWREAIIEKHQNLRGDHRLADIARLPDEAVAGLSFRRAAAAAGAAARARVIDLTRNTKR